MNMDNHNMTAIAECLQYKVDVMICKEHGVAGLCDVDEEIVMKTYAAIADRIMDII